MIAAQIVGPRSVEIVEVEEPPLPESHILVQIERACLCGSDGPLFAYDLNQHVNGKRATPFLDFTRDDPYPLRVGQSIHECLGTVVKSRSGKFRAGDLVLALPNAMDGLCQFISIPDTKAIHLPKEGVSREEILMSQPFGTVIWAFSKLGNLFNQDAVVLGQGPMGLMICHLLSNAGARNIIAMDKLDYRLDAAVKMRATHTVNVDKRNPLAVVQELTGGKMADLVFEAVGHQTETINQCMEMVRPQGTLVAFGVPDHEIYRDFSYTAFFRKNLTMIGSVGPEVVPNYTLARDMIAQGRIDVSPLITHTLPFQEIQRAYELFVGRLDGAIKVIVDYTTLQ
jgi:threonine dehydrogenase-like Zn-dependent dehydrogenase